MKKQWKQSADPQSVHKKDAGVNVISSEWCGTINDQNFLTSLESWNRLAARTAKRLERQIGRPQSEFNRDCLTQELLLHVCCALRRPGIKNGHGFVTAVVRNRARDILRRARACGRDKHAVPLTPNVGQSLTDRSHNAGCRLAEFYERLDAVLGLLTETQQRAVKTATDAEAVAASALGISRRHLRKLRTEIRIAFEREGLQEFLSASNSHIHHVSAIGNFDGARLAN